MISRISLIGFLLLISVSCEKGERVVITGIVTDEVTGNPVAGASVSLKLDYIDDGSHHSYIIQGTTTNSASDGSYKIVYDSDHPEISASNTPMPFPESYYASAIAPGFVGSDLHSLADKNLKNADIKLYHYAQLNLHVKNDGRSMLKEGYVWLDKGLSRAYFGNPEFHFVCKGQNFDSTIVIKNMWGNFKYSYGVIATHGGYGKGFLPEGDNVLSGYITVKPDSMTDFFITF